MKNWSRINCSGCGISFYKETKYIKRAEKVRSGKHYCSLKCFGKNESVKNLPVDWRTSEENKMNLKKICNNRLDEFSPFKSVLKSCRMRTKTAKNKKEECDLDLIYLKELWEKQNGKCLLTGVDLKLESGYNKNYQASLDRIDSSKGYIKGNVRYISVSANWLKNNLNDDHVNEFIQICRMVVN